MGGYDYSYEFAALITDEIENKDKVVHGIVIADSYKEAMEKLERCYGDVLIAITMYGTDNDDGIYEFEYNDTIERLENGTWQEVLVANR
jgi:hypothetical protein